MRTRSKRRKRPAQKRCPKTARAREGRAWRTRRLRDQKKTKARRSARKTALKKQRPSNKVLFCKQTSYRLQSIRLFEYNIALTGRKVNTESSTTSKSPNANTQRKIARGSGAWSEGKRLYKTARMAYNRGKAKPPETIGSRICQNQRRG